MSPKEYIEKNPNCTIEEIKANVDPKNIVSKLNKLIKDRKVLKNGGKYSVILNPSQTLNGEQKSTVTDDINTILIKRIEELERKLTGRKSENLVMEGTLNKSDVPIHDELESPTVFYAIGSQKLYFGYKNRVGVTVQPPYSDPADSNKEVPIKFAFAFRKEGKTSKEFVQFCYYMCYSKKVLEWLRSHPMYKVEFHEQLDAIKDVDQRNQAIRNQVYSEVNNMTEGNVYLQSKSRPSVKMIDDMPELRKRLSEAKIQEQITHMANEQVMRYNNVFDNRDAGNTAKAPIHTDKAVDFKPV